MAKDQDAEDRNAQDWDADRHIDAIAPLMGIEVTDEQRPGVRRFLKVARAMAGQIERAAPGDTLDLAPVFTPVAPKLKQ